MSKYGQSFNVLLKFDYFFFCISCSLTIAVGFSFDSILTKKVAIPNIFQLLFLSLKKLQHMV